MTISSNVFILLADSNIILFIELFLLSTFSKILFFIFAKFSVNNFEKLEKFSLISFISEVNESILSSYLLSRSLRSLNSLFNFAS